MKAKKNPRRMPAGILRVLVNTVFIGNLFGNLRNPVYSRMSEGTP